MKPPPSTHCITPLNRRLRRLAPDSSCKCRIAAVRAPSALRGVVGAAVMMAMLAPALSRVAAAALPSQGGASGTAPEPDQPQFDNSAQSEQLAEGAAKNYAQRAGRSDIKDYIDAGHVEVRVGRLPRGVKAATVPAIPGVTNVPVIVLSADNAPAWGVAVVHEFTHLQFGHTPLPVVGPHSATSLQASGCDELQAHCAALASLYHIGLIHGLLPPCWLRDQILRDAGWESLTCTSGPGQFGPPPPEPCENFTYAASLRCQ